MLAYTAGDGLHAISRAYGIAPATGTHHRRERVHPRGQSAQRNARPNALHQAIRRLTGRG